MLRLRLSLMLALMCGVAVNASVAVAGPTLVVTGAGASSTSGSIVINARATAPATGPFIPVAPAVGFIRAQGTFFGDFNASVTCIAWPGGQTALVSGNLETPFVSGGFTFHNFSLIVAVGGSLFAPWIDLFVDNLADLGNCGESLFFAAGVPDLPNDLVVRGHFAVLG